MPSLFSWRDILDDSETLNSLLRTKEAINGLDEWGANLLNTAIEAKRWDIVELALEQGADVNAPDAAEQTPLLLAVMMSNIPQIRFLLRKGANVNAADYVGETPLISACTLGKVSVAKLLLASGANVHAKTKSGHTALHSAAFNGKLACVELLLEQGADVNEPNPEGGSTALMLAAMEGRRRIVLLLLERGADILARGTNSFVWVTDAFTNAAVYGRTATLELLLDWKPEVLRDAEFSGRLLTRAASHGKISIVRLLLERDVDIHAREPANGDTALMAAIIGGHRSLIELLLHKGAEVTRGNDFQTPLEIAQIKNEPALLRLMNKASASKLSGSKTSSKDVE